MVVMKKEIPLTLHTRRERATMKMPSVGITRMSYAIVKRMQLPDSAPVTLERSLFPLKTQQLLLPGDIATRIYNFSQEAFVEGGHENYDCLVFLRAAMGWGLHGRQAYSGTFVRPDETQNGLPYVMSTPKYGNRSQHAVLGIDQPGISLGVAAREGPLIIAKNTDLLRVFGSTSLLEVNSVSPLGGNE